jgi:lipopolysaccharide biosynthesis protein
LPRLIAFYLPQYHPIPENDEWWGKGFTEWTNTAKARPLFRGHYQPHIPADLGFYDLRLPEAREAQVELARAYGIHGFCYYHYWFGGRRLLERPFSEVLASGRPDFPFCLCWANENWTRRWDGRNAEMLLAQNYSPADDVAHIRSLIPAFRDRRYITINGKPLLLVYRVNLLPNPTETGRIWREEVAKAGFPGLYLCTVIGVKETDFDPRTIGFDAGVEFQPRWYKLPPAETPPLKTLPDAILKRVLPKSLFEQLPPLGRAAYYFHTIISYSRVVETMTALPAPAYKMFPGVTPSWDNSARRNTGAFIFKDSDPATYGRWLRSAIRRSLHRFQGDERLVFVNAWNEWAEGNHLEPDLKWGHRYLEETRSALAYADQTAPSGIEREHPTIGYEESRG